MSQYPQQQVSSPAYRLWWITAIFIAINVGLFGWQVLSGVNINQPTNIEAIRWGADYAPLTFLEEPTRLLTSMFFHFGWMHLLFNMWALYLFGSIAEQMLGRFYFLGMYLLAGLMGSLFSGYINIQDTITLLNATTFDPILLPRVSAGASGAVMGLGAALTMLSLLPVLPHQLFILDKKTLVITLGINLAIGFSVSGINNAAHIGGMMMGAYLALVWYAAQRWQKPVLSYVLGLGAGAIMCAVLYEYDMQLVNQIHLIWQELLNSMKEHARLS